MSYPPFVKEQTTPICEIIVIREFTLFLCSTALSQKVSPKEFIFVCENLIDDNNGFHIIISMIINLTNQIFLDISVFKSRQNVDGSQVCSIMRYAL